MVKSVFLASFLAILSLSTASSGQERKQTEPTTETTPPAHVVVTPDRADWKPFSPFPYMIAAMDGDPSKPGAPYTFWLKFADGERIPPHWHPVDENVVVIQGTFMLGIGEKFDEAAVHALPDGSYGKMPAEVRHYGWTKGETIVQIYGIGPFEIYFVNPADDLRKQTTSR